MAVDLATVLAQLGRMQDDARALAFGDPNAAAAVEALASIQQRAIAEWSRMPREQRAEMLRKLAQLAYGRNASWFAIKTPGVIADEIKQTDAAIRVIDRDITATFRNPFEQQLNKARADFERANGRKSTSDDDAQIFSMMQPPPTARDVEWKTYQGAYVSEWSEFFRAWQSFVADHDDWYDRMWKGSYDTAIDYRKQANAWRARFIALGGTPSTPEAAIPDDAVPWDKLLLVGGLVAAALVLPAAFRAFGKR